MSTRRPRRASSLDCARLAAASILATLVAACGAPEPPSTASEEPQLRSDPAPDLARDAEPEPVSARFELGTHYERLSPTQPTSSSPDQVEVAELFWYGCLHCYELDPQLARWERGKPEYVRFVRIPVVWNPQARWHARAFYTAEALGLSQQMHESFFRALHDEGNTLDTPEKLAEFFGRFGVDGSRFQETFDSFAVHEKLQRAEELTRRYRIQSVPSIVVNGKYTSNGTMAGGYPRLLALVDELAAAERATR